MILSQPDLSALTCRKSASRLPPPGSRAAPPSAIPRGPHADDVIASPQISAGNRGTAAARKRTSPRDQRQRNELRPDHRQPRTAEQHRLRQRDEMCVRRGATAPMLSTLLFMMSAAVTGMTRRCSTVPCSRSRISAASVSLNRSAADIDRAATTSRPTPYVRTRRPARPPRATTSNAVFSQSPVESIIVSVPPIRHVRKFALHAGSGP